jgi:hypothetical protein
MQLSCHPRAPVGMARWLLHPHNARLAHYVCALMRLLPRPGTAVTPAFVSRQMLARIDQHDPCQSWPAGFLGLGATAKRHNLPGRQVMPGC